MNIKEELLQRAAVIERYLDGCIPSVQYDQKKVIDAMRYSLSAGGKRLRPVLFMEFYKLCGGTEEAALDFAAALEMIHTYSLIHDDLPCMDDDDMRRGRPSCHKAFDYPTALLAGDALLNYAFETMLSADCADRNNQIRAAGYIARSSGVFGMIGGQTVDVCENGLLSDINALRQMVSMKTGALIKAACVGGCILAGADDTTVSAVSDYAEYLGEAFQIRDDMLDEIGDEKKLGKKTGSDQKLCKTTFLTELGLQGCTEEVERLSSLAAATLDTVFPAAGFIKELTFWLVGREY